MGVEPVAGRVFTATAHAKNEVKDPQEAMVSSAFARENFGGAEQALGKTVKFNEQAARDCGCVAGWVLFPGEDAGMD